MARPSPGVGAGYRWPSDSGADMTTEGKPPGAVKATTETWPEVYSRLARRDPGMLSADELELVAEAAFWAGRPRETIEARRRAYALHRAVGDDRRAARTAWLLFTNHFELDETAAANGWLKRAQRHAAATADTVAQGYVALGLADWALYVGDLDEAFAHACRAAEAGEAAGDVDLAALGTATQGRVDVARGAVDAGVAQLDEAMLAATSGELSAFVTGWVYCLLLDTCHVLGDVRRAAEWTELALRWCEEQGQDSWYPGLCRLHRCEVAALRGEWTAAEEEALRAGEELAAFGDYLVAEGLYLAGEIRLRRGEHAAAEEAFRRAHELGRDPQPGLAQVRLAQGDIEAAVTALRVALAGGSRGPLPRARLLAAHVQAELRRGGVDAATGSAEELRQIADRSGALLLRAMADVARGVVLLARDDVDAALPLLREACAICRELSCPYETAEARLLCGLAARRAGDEETARLEFEAARATFERLGARPDVERASTLLAVGDARPRGLTAREVEVLRLVARGRTNREIARALSISEHTVARHLTNIFRKLEVTSRAAATAFVFEHDLA